MQAVKYGNFSKRKQAAGDTGGLWGFG